MNDQHDETPQPTAAERVAQTSATVARLSAEVAGLDVEGTPGTAIVPVDGRVPAEAMKAQAAQHRASLVKKTNELKAAREEMRRAMERQMSEAMSVLQPLQERVAQMEEVIWTVNLYLGRDESMTQIRDGSPASADTPIVVRQTVLFMDEETAALAEQGGIDHMQVGVFVDWLQDDAHRDLLLPEARGVVAVKPRREAREDADSETWFLIRNGENLYLLTFEGEKGFKVGTRLVPNRDEFTAMFSVVDPWTREVKTLEPGSREWLKAEKAAAARERHYMRIALILQGLIDRTAAFAPLPEGGVSLLSPEGYNSGRVVLLADEEMAIGDGREPFRTWLSRVNADLRRGVRIIGSFNGQGWRNANEYYYDRDNRHMPDPGHSRLRPATGDGPDSLTIHTLDGTRDGGLTFRYRRGKTFISSGWGRDEYREPKTRSSCMVMPTDPFILAVDFAEIDDMEYYLRSRTNRHEYQHLVPLLRAAIEAKRTEAAAEDPFRALIAAQIADQHSVDVSSQDAQDALDAQVSDLVDWFKFANTNHRPLVADNPTLVADSHEAKALRLIVEEYGRRNSDAAKADAAAEAAAVERIRSEHPTVMFIGRNRSGKIVSFEPQPRAYPEVTTDPNPFVIERTFTLTGRGKTTARDWALPGTRHSRMRLLFETDVWTRWDRFADQSIVMTDPEIGQVAQSAVDAATRHLVDHDTRGDRWGERQSTGPVEVMAVGIKARNQDSVARGLRPVVVFMRPTTPFDPDQEVSTDDKFKAQHIEVICPVKRTDDGLRIVEQRIDTQWGSRYSGVWGDRPIGPLGHGGEQNGGVPWRTTNESRGLPGLIWSDPDVVDRHTEQRAIADGLRTKVADLNRLVSDANSNVQRQWFAAARAEQYERFLSDYQDPDLWEDHSKSLQKPVWPGRLAKGHAPYDRLRTALAVLVNAREPLDGLTVADVAAKAAEHGFSYDPPADIADFLVTDSGPDTDDFDED